MISVGAFEVNCVVVWNDDKEALVIDPGSDSADVNAFLEEEGLVVAGYLLTHGHADHISALAELHEQRPAPVAIHPADLEWCFGETNQISPYYPVPQKPAAQFVDPRVFQGLEKQTPLCSILFQTLETPGHTPGGVCYWFEEGKLCLTGDTLFKGSCGRTDLPGGSPSVLSKSLKLLTNTLPGETQIIAGHGAFSTMEQERQSNFYIQRASA